MPDVTDQPIKNDSLYTALQDSTAAWVRSEGKIEALDRRVTSLEATLDQRLGTMVSHLDTIGRETSRTAELLASEQADRKRREKEARQARTDEQQARSEWRRTAVRVVSELWAVFKVPLGTLITAVTAYIIWSHYQIPSTPTPVEVREIGEINLNSPDAH